MKILALDTSTEACSVAILHGDKVSEDFILPEDKNSNHILQMLEKQLTTAKLKLSQLDAIAFSHGPGSFTGVRVATNVVQGIATAADLPVIAISSLRALAQLCYRQYGAKHVLSALDARMNELYCGFYSLDEHYIMQPITDDKLVAPDTLPSLPRNEDFHGIGSAWNCFAKALHQAYQNAVTHSHPGEYPRAHDIVTLAAHEFTLGNTETVENLSPHYLRNNVAKKGKAYGQ